MPLTPEKRILSFAELGKVLYKLSIRDKNVTTHKVQLTWLDDCEKIIGKSSTLNPWFTTEFIYNALHSIALSLKKENLRSWLARYPELNKDQQAKRIGVIMAGNIPFVGFHDFISVLISGNFFVGKSSSKEGGLMQMIAGILTDIEPGFKPCISFSSSIQTNIDAVIATGSDNSARYFEYDYKNIPTLIRKNKNGIAVLNGTETGKELNGLAEDIFLYFGLGCRSVSKILIPEAYNFEALISSLNSFKNIMNNPYYSDNYRYQSAIFKTNDQPVKDTGFLLLQESFGISSPVAVLFYQYYQSANELNAYLEMDADKFQCIVGKSPEMVPFGKAQYPELWDYADHVDTLKFLGALK
jgi:hypothetical protein